MTGLRTDRIPKHMDSNRTPRLCSIDGCDRVHYGRGFCRLHYMRWWRNGDPMSDVAPIESMLGQPMRDRFFAKVDQNGPTPVDRPELGSCWEWAGGTSGHGYGSFSVKNRTKRAHRVSWELHFGEIPTGMLVLHHCDNPRCVRPDHLFLGTYADNTQDMVQKGRGGTPPRHVGSNHPSAKLSDEDVKSIRSRYASGTVTQDQLAAEFAVSQGTIGFILRNETWKAVE